MKLKLISIILIIVASILLSASIVLAISNPDDIDFGSGDTAQYLVFENVNEDGDMLFVAEGLVEYASEPTDYDASESFIFEVLNEDGDETLISRALEAYGNRPISIYQNPQQVTDLGLVSETQYIIRISGNPLVFASMTGNSVNATLTAADYIDQSIGADSDVPTDNNLRNFCINVAENIEDYDSPVNDYLITIQGYQYLTSEGADIFVEGIPNLYNFCPILFQYGAEAMESDEPESTGTYALTLTPLNKWGQLTADGLTNIGVFLGINQALAGSVVLFLAAIALAVYTYKQTGSGIATTVLVAAAPFIGGFLGLMPMALAFIFVIVIITLMGYYFLSRGAL